ncbi:hypothetical protein PQ478_08300 [Alkalihalophilus pseudofirmus]|uniref:hypothetical protein n=1 Tax=Alkalihalophilus pseudofirmus TaxID=79885 RepID=UPI00259B19DF|nr:hypothetical protein [Alkalihalophilus pseudofirmus]WEG18469.1 hypothetical protein PQ478_08300 [Alkalihalophilus pseudofirmus]
MGFSNHSAAVINNELFMWGMNSTGQCGMGHTTAVRVPTRMDDTKDWNYVSLGAAFTIGIKKDGSLWAWGSNANSALGSGTSGNELEPVRISPFTDWVMVASGYRHSIGLRANGTIYTWGLGSNGQLGHGDTNTLEIPTQVGTDTDWVEVGVGYNHTMAIKSDGSLWTWGYNQYSNLGLDNTIVSITSPTRVDSDEFFTKVTGTQFSTVAINKLGIAYGCGRNNYGELALGDVVQRNTFTPISEMPFIDIQATRFSMLYLRNDHSLFGAGRNSSGELGAGDTSLKNTLTLVADNKISAVATGDYHSTLLERGSNKLYTAGLGSSYQLGNNSTLTRNSQILIQNSSYDTIFNHFTYYRRDVLLNADISPMNIWYQYEINPTVNGVINQSYGSTAQYKLFLNDQQIYPDVGYSDMQATPININLDIINKEDLSWGENRLTFDIVYSNNFKSVYDFYIYLEDKDTTLFNRNQSYSYEWIRNDSITREDGLLRLSEGFKNGTVETSDLNKINTIGKRKISDFQIRASGDSIESSDIDYQFTSQTPMADGVMYSINLDLDSYTSVNYASPTTTFSGGSGTAENPYIIKSPTDLSNIRLFLQNRNVHFALGANIDLDVLPFNSLGWDRIGTSTTLSFQGTLDGRGFAISGLYIPDTGTYNGLFGYISNATIKNLRLVNTYSNNKSNYLGSLAGSATNNTVLDNVIAEGLFEDRGTGSYTGGICGRDDSVTYYDCGSRIKIVTNSTYTAGISGYTNNSNWYRCFFDGELISTTSSNHIAGLGAYGYYCNFYDCYALGTINSGGSSYVAGICTYMRYASSINGCYVATRFIQTGGTYRGALVGRTYNSTPQMINSYWDAEVTGLDSSPNISNSFGLTTEQMKTPSSYVGYDTKTRSDGSPVWNMIEGEYPTLNRIDTYLKMIVQSNSTFYTYRNGDWAALPFLALLNKDAFIEHGFDLVNPQMLQQLPSPTVYVWTNSGLDLVLSLSVVSEMRMRFLVSRDGKRTWNSFISGNWRQILPNNIRQQGMSLDEINSITKEDWNRWFRRGAIDLMVYFESQSITSSPTLESFTVAFPSNEPPAIKNMRMTPEEIGRSNAVFQATIEDLEGDSFRYQMLLNGQSIMKTGDGWSEWTKIDEKVDIYQIFQFSDFATGSNALTILAEDDRGLQSTSPPIIFELVNEKPFFSLFTHDDWSLTGTVIDSDGDKIQYRILINNVQVFPKTASSDPTYSSYFDTPKEIRYVWSSDDLILGEENKITIEIKDEMGAILKKDIEGIIGKYRGLMFKNENGEYYSTDKGDILKFLDFGIIVAGQITEPRRITLENHTGFAVDDLEIALNPPPTGYSVNLSKLNLPFLPSSKLAYGDSVIPENDSLTFYVSVSSSTSSSSSGGTFEIHAKAKPL